jgi:hypothetical protein
MEELNRDPKKASRSRLCRGQILDNPSAAGRSKSREIERAREQRSIERTRESELEPEREQRSRVFRLPELGFRVLGFMTYPKIFFFLSPTYPKWI